MGDCDLEAVGTNPACMIQIDIAVAASTARASNYKPSAAQLAHGRKSPFRARVASDICDVTTVPVRS
jgi:hypothetical protein